jgi:hypothetical protein
MWLESRALQIVDAALSTSPESKTTCRPKPRGCRACPVLLQWPVMTQNPAACSSLTTGADARACAFARRAAFPAARSLGRYDVAALIAKFPAPPFGTKDLLRMQGITPMTGNEHAAKYHHPLA